jgi:hypothetical protein
VEPSSSPKSIRYSVGSSFAAVAYGLVFAQRAAELDRIESEAVSEPVCGLYELFQLATLFAFEQIHLLAAVRETTEGNAKKTNLSFQVPVLVEKVLVSPKDIRIEVRRFW